MPAANGPEAVGATCFLSLPCSPGGVSSRQAAGRGVTRRHGRNRSSSGTGETYTLNDGKPSPVCNVLTLFARQAVLDKTRKPHNPISDAHTQHPPGGQSVSSHKGTWRHQAVLGRQLGVSSACFRPRDSPRPHGPRLSPIRHPPPHRTPVASPGCHLLSAVLLTDGPCWRSPRPLLGCDYVAKCVTHRVTSVL